jgi:predicted ester cyclase
MTETDPRHVIERYLREVLKGSATDAADELIGSDVVRQKVLAFRGPFPDLAVTPNLVVAEGPYVAVHLTASGTHAGIFLGVPATGRRWAASCSAIYRVEHGRVIDSWVNWDLLTILEQLGGVQRAATASA